jgi:hypothetical protein
MSNDRPVEQIFEQDEMVLRKVNKAWSAEDLLNQDGIFFLKDIVGVLDLDSAKVIKKAREVQEKGQSSWQVMGIRKVWNHWAVRMKVFAPYYRKYLRSWVKAIQDDWDSNVLLKQKGIFLLSEVCELIPFSTYQIRYQANKVENSAETYGIWKDEQLNRFVVDMEKFSGWIKSLWKGNFNRS